MTTLRVWDRRRGRPPTWLNNKIPPRPSRQAGACTGLRHGWPNGVGQAASIETPSHPHTPHTWTSAPSETAPGVCCRESGRLRPRSLACSFPLGGRRATLHPGPHTPNRSGLQSDWPWVRCRSLGHARGSSAEIAVDMNGIACQCLPQSGRLEDGTNKLVPGSWFPPLSKPLARPSSRPSRPAPCPLPGGVWSMPSWFRGVYTRAACRSSWHRSRPTLRLASSPTRPPPPQPYLYAPFPNPPSLSRYL